MPRVRPLRLRACAIASIALAASVAGAGCAASEPDATAGGEDDLKERAVDVTRTSALPIREVSGLGRRRVGGAWQYLAVGDAEPTLVTFDVNGGVPSRTITHDLSAAFGRGASQWEAVAGDGRGLVFVLAESAGTITALDADLRRVVHTMELVVPKGHPLASDWKKDENSRAEGMVLLANGHVLVVKEKDPVALVELAPEGEAPEGYRADLALGTRAFPLPSGARSRLVATKHWLLGDGARGRADDVSELAVDDEGRLLLLGDQGRAVLRIERTLRVDEERLAVKSVFRLPSRVDKPEGLVLADGTPLVAVDQKAAGETLFTLAPLP